MTVSETFPESRAKGVGMGVGAKMRKHRLLAIMCVAIVCAALITTVGSAFTAKSMAASTPWTGTWSVSPESGGASFSQQTLRQIVHTSIGGTSAQVQVSNVFGDAPLVIADVHVALRSSGSTIVSGADHTVTFGGQASITIPAGGLAISDAVAMSVPALSDVAVSMYLPQSTGSSTYHQQGTVTNYIASGDVSGNASLPGAQTTNSYFFLTNLNVQNPAAQGAVVTLGASITDGYASTTDANERWPNDLAVRLTNSGRTIGVLNQGISGNPLNPRMRQRGGAEPGPSGRPGLTVEAKAGHQPDPAVAAGQARRAVSLAGGPVGFDLLGEPLTGGLGEPLLVAVPGDLGGDVGVHR
jgi:hypothetical protein